MSKQLRPAQFQCLYSGNQLELHFSGDWLIEQACPRAQLIIDAVVKASSVSPSIMRVSVVTSDTLRWDSQLVSRLYQCQRQLHPQNIQLDVGSLPTGIQALLNVATTVEPVNQPDSQQGGFFTPLNIIRGLGAISDEVKDFVRFVGEIVIACGRLVKGQANTRWSDFFNFVEQAGPSAIGIITLVSVLVGMILAYLGLVQLRLFGAEIYVANLVTIGMVREMGVLMTAVVMAGRTGAAYAAQLGTMQANEEVDAITTLGISPIEFLVLPRMFALICMMPLLCIYSNAVGLIGGAVVASGMDITLNQYIAQSRDAIDMTDVMTGLFKSLVFGVLIAIAGCKAGIQSGRNSAAVGKATTKAVVTATVYLVVADASLNIIYDKLGI